ncbi:NAD(P)/FAD-dependent oxidoreductase [Deinococcus hopiensis]|uniref:Amine oxidase domain-containing protein n=1 Tax=Deinococcus hopiensis KR-140 TaxID=695939 RepID=A0A1W1UGB0_9DEIO|nr:FAD-dependent oxidoreductase [Deinococcus hopiensis]SMB80100.1 hypothetical protein SAMN00790413_05414 [Deinococcus hopiensis KR-140]
MSDILVLGAGVGGLAAARDLAAAGDRVQLLDKARGVSGRAATRRFEAGRLDHGARFLTARQARTQALVGEGLTEGWLREWTRQFSRWQAGEVTPTRDGHPRYVGARGMSDLGKALAQDLEIHTGTHISSLGHTEAGWTLTADDGRTFMAPTLLLNAPAPQLALLLRGVTDTAALDAVTFQPCWAVGAVLDEDLPVDWPALNLEGHPSLAWIAREHTKRPGPPALTLHADAAWSAAHLEATPEQVQRDLLQAAEEVVGELRVRRAFAHRWRYATPERRFPQACGWVPGLRLGWCGDWCVSDGHGPRLEAALLSGWALAEALRTTGT